MRLHNHCIDRRISLELRQVAGMSEIKPQVWMPTPDVDMWRTQIKNRLAVKSDFRLIFGIL